MEGLVDCRLSKLLRVLAVRVLASNAASRSSRILPPLVHCLDLAGPGVSLFSLPKHAKHDVSLLPDFPLKGLGGGLGVWVISLDLHGSVSPRECPWHVQHFAQDLVRRLVVRLPPVLDLCVLTTSLAGHSVRRP